MIIFGISEFEGQFRADMRLGMNAALAGKPIREHIELQRVAQPIAATQTIFGPACGVRIARLESSETGNGSREVA
nr:hypothetical protein DBT45_10915 [Aerococcus tenax]